MRKDGEARGEAWTNERVATVGSAASSADAAELTAACVRILWPEAMPPTSAKDSGERGS